MTENSELERKVLTTEQGRTLAHAAYNDSRPLLLLDTEYNLFFASREAERQLGYRLEHIRMDTKRFQTEKKQCFDEIAKDQFTKGALSFDLKDILYQSTDKRYNILMDLHVERLQDGGVCITLGKVQRYEAKKQPGMFQFRYKKAAGDQTVVVKGFIDHRNDKQFMEHVNNAYVRVSGAQMLVVDLTHAKDVMEEVLHSLAHRQNLLFVNPNEAMTKALLEAGVLFERIQRYDPETSIKPSPSPA